MTCKDCIHEKLCFDNGTLFLHFTTTGRKAENVETNCPFKNFKNKADFVEVPCRCGECKLFVENKEALVTYCKRECRNLTVNPTDFCSYGERK